MDACLITAVSVGSGHQYSQLDFVQEPQGDPAGLSLGQTGMEVLLVSFDEI